MMILFVFEKHKSVHLCYVPCMGGYTGGTIGVIAPPKEPAKVILFTMIAVYNSENPQCDWTTKYC